MRSREVQADRLRDLPARPLRAVASKELGVRAQIGRTSAPGSWAVTMSDCWGVPSAVVSSVECLPD